MIITKKSIVNLHWPMIISTTVLLYLLIVVTLPFSTKVATIFLFALIAYWSRLPGVGIPSPFFILYHMDFVDLFSLIISINVGPVEGAIFSVFGNVWSRMAGITPPWGKTVIKDTIYQVIVCLMSPFLYNLFNHNILLTMSAYTILRRVGFFITWFIIHDISATEFVILWTGATSVSFFINFMYAKYFGNYLDGLLASGVSFSWELFIFATITIFLARWYMFEKPISEKPERTYSDRVEGWVKLKLYLFFDRINLWKIVRKLTYIPQSENKDPFPKQKPPKHKGLYNEFMAIRNPEDVLLDFFEDSNDEGLLKGKFRRFCLHAGMLVITFVVLACIRNSYMPNFIEMVFSLALALGSVYFLVLVVKHGLNKMINLL